MTDLWTATAQRAASQARWLRPLALTMFIIGLVAVLQEMVVSREACVADLMDGGARFSLACAFRELGAKLVVAGPTLALLWALYETQAYLKRLEDGDVFAPSTMKLFARIGECLIAAALWSAVFAPTLSLWISGQGVFDWRIEAEGLALGGLGVSLTTIARVLGDVLTSAAAAKADADAIV